MQSAQLQSKYYTSWHPYSWKSFATVQQPYYENISLLEHCILNLKNSINLVTEEEINSIKFYLHEAAKGNVFILQAGDCAETFLDCNNENVIQRVSHLQRLQELLQNNIKKPVIVIGRIAGQYAKPRSEFFETINDITLPCYRGDIINGFNFNSESRKADPLRLIRAFECSKLTYNWIRDYLNLNIGINRHSFYCSHEALHLDYESALTRLSLKSGKWLNYGTHFLWLGERTKNLNGAHVEYLRGISNPIGIKIGPHTSPNELISLLKVLNPENQMGRITLITRFGVGMTQEILPSLLDKIKRLHIAVTWSCDPMHGNGQKTKHGIKTRYFQDIWQELKETIEIHNNYGSSLSGAHFEISPFDVTECVGGECLISETQLKNKYLSYCDPRLNNEQSKEIILNLGNFLNNF
ncbi:3-deoxy-7-phosphoheptulonate synthase [Fluviispira multicolorata]|uniref:Phospho-2-dehydro-3-deoxyheptonate aldolase n=1 Tax=Fluviispira multicolorata TaxID=2654512 RepID=A0A833N583_9BACT|nr:3-deoxy-7-phosphoheptulonate synthase [Fluviispira multicolorata]KAB8033562.1 3-deoxy-7-phosphoheptulonate synthase class II [Fluviispira multicolorata]